MDLISIAGGAVLPYIVAGVFMGVRRKSLKDGFRVAGGMLKMTVGMFSENLKIESD